MSNFDTGSMPPPSSLAISAIASAQHEAIDPTLLDALANPRERMNALKFEDKIVRFVNNKYVNK